MWMLALLSAAPACGSAAGTPQLDTAVADETGGGALLPVQRWLVQRAEPSAGTVEVGVTYRGLRGVLAQRQYKRGERVMQVPLRDVVDLGPFAWHLSTGLDSLPLSAEGYKYALEQLSSAEGAPYAESLPDASRECMVLDCWTAAEVRELQEPILAETVAKRQTMLAEILQDLEQDDKRVTHSALLNVHFAVQSRPFLVKTGPLVCSGSGAERTCSGSGETHALLVPLLDMINSDTEQKQNCESLTGYDDHSQPVAVLVQAIRDIAVGDEVSERFQTPLPVSIHTVYV
jgi:hypothetical protein